MKKASMLPTTTRTWTYTAKLSKQTHVKLDEFLDQQNMLWNDALKERLRGLDNCRRSCGYVWKDGKSIWQCGKEWDTDDRRLKQGCGRHITYEIQCSGDKELNAGRAEDEKVKGGLTRIREDDEWFNGFSVEAQRSTLRRLNWAWGKWQQNKKEGKKGGKPRFKNRRNGIDSFDAGRLAIKQEGQWHTVKVSGIGKFRFKGKWQGEVRLVRIARTARRVNVQLVCEIPVVPVVDTRPPIGIDAGVKKRFALSNRTKIPKKEIGRRETERLGRKVSRSVKGSKNRKKKVMALRKEHQRVADAGKAEQHRLTAKLVKEHSAHFAVEDLKIQNMTAKGGNRKKGMNRAILRQSWGAFYEKLAYKAEEAGGYVVRVKPENTTQMCSACQKLPAEKVRRGDEVYLCKHCGHEDDRDFNASDNILRRGFPAASGVADPGTQGEGRKGRPARAGNPSA